MDIAQTVRGIVAERIDCSVAEVTEESKLVDIGLDSLDLLEVVFEIETALDVELPYNANEAGANAMTSVGDVIQMLEAETS